MEDRRPLNPADRDFSLRLDLLVLGLWIRAVPLGAAFAAAGVVSLLDPPQGVPFLTAVTWIFSGVTFAWLAWQRADALLDRAGGSRPSATTAERTIGRNEPDTIVTASRVPG